MHQWRTWLHSCYRINHRWQWLPVDMYQVQRIFRCIAVLGSYRHDCFANVAHFIESNSTLDDWLGTEGGYWINHFSSLTTSQHSINARQLFRSTGIDADNTGMRIGAAQYSGMEHAGEFHIVGIDGSPHQQRRVFTTLDVLADPRVFSCCHDLLLLIWSLTVSWQRFEP